ncbi:MAG: helix-turn-helix transcriptional regulator [Flavobacteriales bacterium]|nr:helix-turn-helix transcriptional regulator [Flavobacteriales bacterium]MCB9186426.1 helix-turn-helix transcriptional regulator [Flavobacteriales bacterium]
MAKNQVILLPKLKKLLKGLGENIRLARLRRKLSAEQVSERAGISRNTLTAIENGKVSTSIGGYVSVLAVLGLEQDLSLIAKDDELGRKLQDAQLSHGERAPKRSSK